MLRTAAILPLLLIFRPGTLPADDRAFLGIHVKAVPAEVRAQTTLEEGTGLIVDFVQPDSPAAAAGVKLHDILLTFDDQRLLSCEQMENLMKTARPGQDIKLTALRRGQTTEVKATLGKATAKSTGFPTPSPAVIDQIANLLRQHPEAAKTLPDILRQLGDPKIADAPGKLSLATQSMSDADGVVEIKQSGGKRTAVVKDAAGKTLFEGPWNTETDRTAAPEAMRQRLEHLENSARLAVPEK